MAKSSILFSRRIGGKDRWIRRLQGLANELRLRIEEIEPEEEARVESIRRQLSDLDELRGYALPLIERLADLPRSANWGEWLAHLRELALNALRYPEGVLTTLADLEPMERVGPVDLHEICRSSYAGVRHGGRLRAEADPLGPALGMVNAGRCEPRCNRIRVEARPEQIAEQVNERE